MMLIDMWRAMREILRLEIEEKVKKNTPLFPTEKRESIWIPRNYLAISLFARFSIKRFMKNIFVGEKRGFFSPSPEENIFSDKEKAEGIIDNLTSKKFGFLEKGIRVWEPESNQTVYSYTVTVDKNGQLKKSLPDQEVIRITPEGRLFASSRLILFKYIRREIGLKPIELMLILVTTIAVVIFVTGLLLGKISLGDIWDWSCNKLGFCKADML